MNTPTPDEVRAKSELLAAKYPDGAPGDEAIAALLDEAVPLAMSLTARTFDDVDVTGAPSPLGCEWEAIPAWLEPVALRALVGIVERGVVTGARRSREGSLRPLLLRSFTAGPYSESYFGPTEAASAKRLAADSATHDALWALATECARLYWQRAWGELDPAPAAAVQSFDYRRQLGGY